MGFKDAAAKPHYLGHRERLRRRFREAGADALPDYELLELILFRAVPRRDTKPLAKAILAQFGSYAEALNAPEERLKEVPGLGEAAITEIKLVRAAALRLVRGEVLERVWQLDNLRSDNCGSSLLQVHLSCTRSGIPLTPMMKLSIEDWTSVASLSACTGSTASA